MSAKCALFQKLHHWTQLAQQFIDNQPRLTATGADTALLLRYAYHRCSPAKCRFVKYDSQYVCLYSGNVHVCSHDCAFNTDDYNAGVKYCSWSGAEYPLDYYTGPNFSESTTDNGANGAGVFARTTRAKWDRQAVKASRVAYKREVERRNEMLTAHPPAATPAAADVEMKSKPTRKPRARAHVSIESRVARKQVRVTLMRQFANALKLTLGDGVDADVEKGYMLACSGVSENAAGSIPLWASAASINQIVQRLEERDDLSPFYAWVIRFIWRTWVLFTQTETHKKSSFAYTALYHSIVVLLRMPEGYVHCGKAVIPQVDYMRNHLFNIRAIAHASQHRDNPFKKAIVPRTYTKALSTFMRLWCDIHNTVLEEQTSSI